jgi:hypothetical protein
VNLANSRKRQNLASRTALKHPRFNEILTARNDLILKNVKSHGRPYSGSLQAVFQAADFALNALTLSGITRHTLPTLYASIFP